MLPTRSRSWNGARAAEVEFANRHPVAEGFVRQLIDTLSRMGV